MRKGALLQRYEVFVAAACMASHANAPAEGFRQRDVKFLIELFSNWVESPLFHSEVSLNNTQVSRYLDLLAEGGYAWRTTKRGAPLYRLSRVGFLDLLNRILPGNRFIRAEQFAFIYYFLVNYRDRILRVVESEGKQFPTAIRLEVEALLDIATLVGDQLRYAELELKKMDEQIRDSKKGALLARDLFSAGHATASVAREVEKVYPYQLNSQKPLSQLMKPKILLLR